MATKEDNQDVFTKDSLNKSIPLIKKLYDDMDMLFNVTEGKQETGKFGIKPRRSDDCG